MTDLPFAEAWPEVERRLLRMLQRRHRLSRARAEDFVQEAALRVVRERIQFDDADDLYRWTAVVVRRLAIDAWRRDRFLTSDAVLVDRPDLTDVEHQVERRLALEAVLRRWPSLSRRARTAIVMAVEQQDVSADEVEAYQAARYRGRQALRRASKGLLGWLGIARLRKVSPAALTAAPVVLAAILLLPSVGLFSDRTTPGDDVRRGGTTGEENVRSPAPGAGSAPLRSNPSSAPEAGGAGAGRTPREVIGASAPAGVVVAVQEDRGATGPLICTHPGPPISGDICSPRVRDVVELLPNPVP